MIVRAGVRCVYAVVLAAALAVSSLGAAAAGTDAAASGSAAAMGRAASASAADDARPGCFVVQPGQSLNDIASAVIPSHDRAMRNKMVALLFDANPSAFMGRDPNRLKIGAVIQVPSGAVEAMTMAGAIQHAPQSASTGVPPQSASTAQSAVVPTRAALVNVAPAGGASQAASEPVAQAGAPIPVSADVTPIVPAPGAAVSATTCAAGAPTAQACAPVVSNVVPRTSANVFLPSRSLTFVAGCVTVLAIVMVGVLMALARRRRRAATAGAAGTRGADLSGDATAVAAVATRDVEPPTPMQGGKQHMPLAPDFPADAAAALASLELSLPPLPDTPVSMDDAVVAAAEHDEPAAPLLPPGAAHWGALKLNFDLDLPPLAAQASIVPTLDEIAAIARNKLDLAVEYMKRGDVAGARVLLSEVVSSNDPTTLGKARELQAVLSPL